MTGKGGIDVRGPWISWGSIGFHWATGRLPLEPIVIGVGLSFGLSSRVRGNGDGIYVSCRIEAEDRIG